MMIRFGKPLRIFFISILATVILFVITSALISLFYEKAMVRFMKSYLDEHLLTQVAMDEIRFRVLKDFPNATVEISNMVVFSGKNFTALDFGAAYADTLLQAGEVSFQFDLLKLIRKNYELKKIEISEGTLNVLFDKKDKHNLHIWKGSETDSGTGYAINLRSIVFSKMKLRVVALLAKTYLASYSKKTSFRGTYSENILSGDAKSELAHTSLLIRDKNWTKDADLLMQLNILYTNGRFRLRKGKISLNKAAMLVKGEYKSGKSSNVDLTVDIPNFGLAEVIALLPFSNKELTSRYGFNGKGSLHATVRGPVSNPDQLLINGMFKLTDCSALNLNTRAAINHIYLTGSVAGTRSENFILRIVDFTSELGKGTVRGNLQLKSLKDLNFKAVISSTIDLNALNEFIEIDSLENIKGSIQSTFTAAGKLGNISGNSLALLLETISQGSFQFNEVGVRLKNPSLTVEHINGRASISDRIKLDSLSVSFNGNDLLLDGTVRNLSGYLMNNSLLLADLNIHTDKFSINNYLLAPAQRKKSRSSKPASLFPSGIRLNAHVRANAFTGGKFSATNLDFNFTLIGDSIFIHNFNLKFPDGLIRGNALVTGDSLRTLSVTCNAEPENINIQQLFTSFNNFAQQFILDKNVRGLLYGKVSFFVQWDSSFNFISQSMKARAEIEIKNGELVQFEPMMKLSKYINLEELKLIRFSNLKNEIYIQDRLVTVPEMDIHTSAFNISVSGTHTFDNVFDYRMKVLLSEVLFNKARKKKEINEFMVEETQADQTTIPLIIAGTPDAFDVKFDRRRAFDLTRKNMQHPASSTSKPDAGNFRIEWDEDKPAPKDAPANNNESPSDFKVEWDDE